MTDFIAGITVFGEKQVLPLSHAFIAINSMELQRKKRKLIKSVSRICFMYCHLWVCVSWCCLSRACNNNTCDDICTPTIGTSRNRSFSWMCRNWNAREKRVAFTFALKQRMKTLQNEHKKCFLLMYEFSHNLTCSLTLSVSLSLYFFIPRLSRAVHANVDHFHL